MKLSVIVEPEECWHQRLLDTQYQLEVDAAERNANGLPWPTSLRRTETQYDELLKSIYNDPAKTVSMIRAANEVTEKIGNGKGRDEKRAIWRAVATRIKDFITAGILVRRFKNDLRRSSAYAPSSRIQPRRFFV